MHKAFLIDLDGTIIGRDELISPRVVEAVGKVSGRLKVSITTGREPADVIRFAKELGLTTPQVSDNGALVLDPSTGKGLWSVPLDPENARRVVARISDLGLPLLATHAGGTATKADDITNWDLTRVSALDMEEDAADELVAYFEPNRGVSVVKASLPYNGKWAVDFNRAGVNKATSARFLAQMLGIDTGQMIAAGDSHNDLALLQACGLRIAMGDAPEELKAIADYVAPSVDEDGLAVAIEEFVLPRL